MCMCMYHTYHTYKYHTYHTYHAHLEEDEIAAVRSGAKTRAELLDEQHICPTVV